MTKEDDFNNKILEEIKNEKSITGKRQYQTDSPQTSKVSIRPDKRVPRSKFWPDPDRPGGYLAHPATIKGMKKDIFVTDGDLLELEKKVPCKDCGEELDLNFWVGCPFCERPLDYKIVVPR